MGIWPKRTSELAQYARPVVKAAQTFPSTNTYQTTTGSAVEVSGMYTPAVSRALAMSVPAIQRGVSLKVTTFAGLPWERIDRNGNRIDVGWIEQPEQGRSRFTTFCDLAYDIEFEGVAYLRVLKRTATGEPARGGCEYIELRRIGTRMRTDGTSALTIDNVEVDPSNVIGFQGWHDGILRHGARTIRMALALEAAALRYADTPRPSERLENISEWELTDEEIDEALAAYKLSRNSEAVGYVSRGFKVTEAGWDAAQLQLVEARQFMATQCANLVGVSPHYIAGAAASSGGTVTYSNVTQDNRGLIDYGLKPMIQVFESRLSLSDVQGQDISNQVTPRGTVVRVRLDDLLRGNPLERAQLYQLLIPLGVLTVEEARIQEDLSPTGRPTT